MNKGGLYIFNIDTINFIYGYKGNKCTNTNDNKYLLIGHIDSAKIKQINYEKAITFNTNSRVYKVKDNFLAILRNEIAFFNEDSLFFQQKIEISYSSFFYDTLNPQGFNLKQI